MTSRKLHLFWWVSVVILAGACIGLVFVLFAERDRNTHNISAVSSDVAHPTPLAVELLDAYAGYYQWDDDDLITEVKRDGNKMFVLYPTLPVAEIYAEDKTHFVDQSRKRHFNFIADPRGHATSITLPVPGGFVAAPRIDPEVGRQIFAAQVSKYLNQTATPGSSAALKRALEGIFAGQPHYQEMSADLAQDIRQNLAVMREHLGLFGVVRAIEFQGVDQGNGDIYLVTQDHAYTKWHINLSRNKVIKTLYYSVDTPFRTPI